MGTYHPASQHHTEQALIIDVYRVPVMRKAFTDCMQQTLLGVMNRCNINISISHSPDCTSSAFVYAELLAMSTSLTSAAAAAASAAEREDADAFRLATPADRARVCGTIGAAFVSAASPEMSYFFGDRFAELAPVFAGNLFDKRVGRSTVWVTDNCDAAALWDAPEQPSSSSGAGGEAAAPAPAAPTPVPLPADVRGRLDTYDRVVHDLLPSQPYWYLGILARHPSRQGSGLARRLTQIALERASRDGVPAVLETTNPLNVAAYERAGWTVHAVNDELQPAMRIWVMRHDGGAVSEQYSK